MPLFKEILIPSSVAIILISALAMFSTNAYATTETFVLLADTHVQQQGDGGGVTNNADCRRAFNWAKKQKNLKAVVVAGDMTDRGYAMEYNLYKSLWNQANIKATRIQCIGNHDTNGGAMWDSSYNISAGINNFKNKLNGGNLTTYNEFKMANIMTIGGGYTKSKNQIYTTSMLQTLNKRLTKTAHQGKWAIVVCHYPYFWSAPNQKKLMGILRSFPNVIYVSGHVHTQSASRRFQTATPGYTKSTYKRDGITVSKTAYNFKSISLSSVTRNHDAGGYWTSSGWSSYGNVMQIKDGKITIKRRNLSSGKWTNTWTLNKHTGTVNIKSKSSTSKASGKMTYKVTFSDGKKHGGVANGSTFTLQTGKTKKISGIPSGVLVTVYTSKVPSNWSKASTTKVEATRGSSTVTMSHKYTKPATSKTTNKNTTTTKKTTNANTTTNTATPSKTNNSAKTTTESIKYGWIALDSSKKPVLQGSNYKLASQSKPIAWITNGKNTKAVNAKSVVYLGNTKKGAVQALIIGDNIVGCKDAFITTFTLV